MSEKRHGCRQKDCDISDGGTCLEGLPPEECPHHFWLDASFSAEESVEDEMDDGGKLDVQEASSERSTNAADPSIDDEFSVVFPSGDALRPKELKEVTREHSSTFVIIAGAPASGKTTLLASIHESFQEGPFAGLTFAGSSTLPAFEKCSFHSRIASGRSEPQTMRTEVSDGIRFLHLAVQKPSAERWIRHFLLSDISGELFDEARRTDEDTQALELLAQGSLFAVLVDGAKICQPERRQKAKTNAFTLLESLLKNELVTLSSRVAVVITKWDLCADDDHAEQFAVAMEKHARERFESRVGKLELMRIAARPDPDAAMEGPHNVDHFLSACFAADVSRIDVQQTSFVVRPKDRESIRFSLYESFTPSRLSPEWNGTGDNR